MQFEKLVNFSCLRELFTKIGTTCYRLSRSKTSVDSSHLPKQFRPCYVVQCEFVISSTNTFNPLRTSVATPIYKDTL